MIDAGDDLGGATKGHRERPLLRDSMEIYRDGEWYVKVVPYARSSEFLFWTARLPHPPDVDFVAGPGPHRYDAPHRSGRFPQGISNPFPAPSLPGAELTVIPGVS
jgi:hypothetical protein